MARATLVTPLPGSGPIGKCSQRFNSFRPRPLLPGKFYEWRCSPWIPEEHFEQEEHAAERADPRQRPGAEQRGRLRLGGGRLDAPRPLPDPGQRRRHATTRRSATLTLENAEAVHRAASRPTACARSRASSQISEAGRAPKNDPALFALAMCASLGDDAARAARRWRRCRASARTGTHLFHFAAVRGRDARLGPRAAPGGRRAGTTPCRPRQLAYQAIKYQQRDGWATATCCAWRTRSRRREQHVGLYHWIVEGWEWVGEEPHPDPALRRSGRSSGPSVRRVRREIVAADPRVPPAARGGPDAVAERAGGLGGAAGARCR